MALCDCGEHSPHIKASEKQGEIKWICRYCSPADFPQERHTDPSDKKVWGHADAFPHLYKQRADGTLESKDELIADTIANINADPDREKKEWKRRNRRTEPMSEWEIEQAKKRVEAWWNSTDSM